MAQPRFRLEFHPTADVDAEVTRCEADVFAHWYGNTAEEFADEYGPYEASTSFVAVRDVEGPVVGTCRLIRPGPAGLKTLVDLGGPPWQLDAALCVRAAGIDPARTWDVATIAVRSHLGGPGALIAPALFHGLALASRANDVEWMTAVLDRRARLRMAVLGLDVHTLPGATAAEYLGSAASTPVFARLGSLLDRQVRVNPEGHRMLVQGHGLTDVAVPRLERFRLPDAPAAQDPAWPPARGRLARACREK